MKTSDKLIEAYDKFRPHINGHKTAMDLFLEALKEVKEMEQELSKLHQPTVSDLVCDNCGNDFFVTTIGGNKKCHRCGKAIKHT